MRNAGNPAIRFNIIKKDPKRRTFLRILKSWERDAHRLPIHRRMVVGQRERGDFTRRLSLEGGFPALIMANDDSKLSFL